jgi:hypothetical protein
VIVFNVASVVAGRRGLRPASGGRKHSYRPTLPTNHRGRAVPTPPPPTHPLYAQPRVAKRIARSDADATKPPRLTPRARTKILVDAARARQRKAHVLS